MKICKRCLLDELDEGGLYRTVQEHIALLDESVKAEPPLYRERLELCRECDHLTNGMCALCGCFVELRAAKKDMYCPDSVKKW